MFSILKLLSLEEDWALLEAYIGKVLFLLHANMSGLTRHEFYPSFQQHSELMQEL